MPAWPALLLWRPLVVLGPAEKAQNDWAKTEYRIGAPTLTRTRVQIIYGLAWVGLGGVPQWNFPTKRLPPPPKACLMCI
jgi:hypothetical protein